MSDASSRSDDSSYDTVPYPGTTYPQSHPDRLASLATLYGLRPAPVDDCRVLELGCGTGENLLPLALRFPRSSFHGVDLSRVQVAAAERSISELGLRNLHVEQADLSTLDEGPAYDYVIAHGVYSWVPPPVRAALLRVCRRHLAPQGVAYVSYNVLPGWHFRSVVREALLFHLQGVVEPRERVEQGRAMLEFLRAAIGDVNSAHRLVFDEVARTIASNGEQERSLLFHDLLESENSPIHFTGFIEHATAQGLRFLAEADLSDMSPELHGESAAATLARLGGDVVRREQYLDFIVNRSFRQSLLCRDDAEPHGEPRADALMQLAVACKPSFLQGAGNEREGARLRVRDVRARLHEVNEPLLRAAVLVAAEHWPGAMTWSALTRETRARAAAGARAVVQPAREHDAEEDSLRAGVLRLARLGIVELWSLPPMLASEATARPRASRWARHRVARGLPFCSLRNEPVEFAELSLSLIALLDGTRDHDGLVDELSRLFHDDGLVLCVEGEVARGGPRLREMLAALLPRQLRMLAQAGLLEA